MKKVLKSMFLLLSAGVFAMVGKAVEPIATWTFKDGQLVASSSDYTLNLGENGENTVTDDYVTIGETTGLTVSGLNIQNWAIVVDVENAPATGVVLDAKLKSNNYIGLYSTNNNLKCRWTNNLTWGACKDNWAPTNRQLITMTYSYAGVNGSPTGTSIYINGAFVVSHAGLRTDSNLDSFVIGLDAQSRTEENLLATGMKVYSVRLYDTRLLDAEAPNYQTLSPYAKYSPVHTAKTLADNKQFHETVFTRMTDGVEIAGTSSNYWHVFASQIKSNGVWGNSTPFNQDGATLRLTTPAASAHVFNASYSPLSFTGLIVEAGATGYSFENTDTNEDSRRCELGNRIDQTATSYFTLHENFTLKRSDMHLYGPCVFEIDNGKTFAINTSHTTRPVVVKENASVTLTNGGLLKITGNLKLENGTTLNGHTNASAATTSDAGTIQITDNVLVNSGASIGGSGTINCVLKLADGANLDASQGMLKANEVWMLSGAPNATVTLPANAADGTAILACKNNQVSDLVNDLSTKVAAKDFKCVAVEEDGYKVIKLAVTKVTVTLPTVENATWLYKGEKVSGSIKVDPKQEVILTLQPGDLYVFAGGGASQTVTIPVGTTNVTVNAEALNLPEVVAAKAAIGNVKYASVGTACEAADDGDTIVLLQDLAIDKIKEMNFGNKTITLDLNGKTQTATVSPAILVTSGTLNLINNNSDKDATITAPGVVIQQGVKNADPVTETTVNIGKDVILISANETADDGDNVVLLYGKATLTSEGVLSTTSQNYAAIQGSGGDKGANTSITINGGSVTSWFNHAIYQPQAGTVTINGGEIEGVTGIEMRAGTLTVNGGKITATAEEYTFNKNGDGSTVTGAAIAVSPHAGVESITATINGGTIGDDETARALAIVHTIDAMPPEITATITAKAIAADAIDMGKVEVDISDLEFKKNDDGSYTLGMKTTGAIIKNEWYETLQAAINAAAPGDRVILLGDEELTTFVTINKTIGLNLNGHSITREGKTALYVNDAAAAVTITGNGTVSGDQAVYVNAGTVTIENGTFCGISHAVYVQGTGNAVIKGGTFSSEDGQYHYVLNKYDADRETTSIKVLGGKFYGFNPANNGAEGKGTNFCADGYIAVAGTDDDAGYYIVKEGAYVAQIGTEGYETLQAAVDAAEEGATVKLLDNVDITTFVTIAKSITLDLDGKMIYRTDDKTALYVDAADKTVTITGEGIIFGDHAVYVNAGTVTIENGTFCGISHAVYVINNGNVVIKDGTFSSEEGQYHYVLNEYDATRDATSIVVKGGKFLDFDPANNEAEGANTNFCADGYIAVAEGEFYTVKPIIIDDKLDNSPAAEAIKDAMQDAGVAAIKGYTITTKGAGETADVDAVADVLEIFDVNPTVDNEGKLTVAYEFGISKVEYIGNGKVKITAGVTGAEYRAGVEVTFDANGAVIGTATTTADSTTVSITDIDAATLDGKKITVKAATK